MHNKKLNGIVLKELLKSGKEGGLGGIEMVDGVVMSEEEWNPQNVRCSWTLRILFLPFLFSLLSKLVMIATTILIRWCDCSLGLYDGGAKSQSEESFGGEQG